MTFKKFKKELNGGRVEGELLKTMFYSLLISFLFLALIYFLKLKWIEGAIGNYGYALLFSALSIALIMPTVRQIRAYEQMACMSGMMVGMTIGMVSGFLFGFFVASTNGMFYGGFFGVFVGMVMGIWLGKCCGIMGIMEGIMAGFMGGLMGAMTAVMMFNDNLKAAGVLSFIIASTIIFGLNYMIYKEMEHIGEQKKEDFTFIIGLTFVLIVLSTWLIVYGPKSVLFG